MNGSAVASKVLAEVGSPAIAPQEPRGASPSTQEQGASSKWTHPDEAERGSGGSPPQTHLPPDGAEVSYQFLCFFLF